MNRTPLAAAFMNSDRLIAVGLTPEMIITGIAYTHNILDMIDKTLVESGEQRLAKMIELPNLSSMIGNLFASGIAKASHGRFIRNRSHAYQDLKAVDENLPSIEVKVALEDNKPKGHLAKPGYYLTCRYVLCDAANKYSRGKGARGEVVWLWEVRFGYLDLEHFTISNTAGDSGKTAVVNAKGMEQLAILYADLERCPYSQTGRTFRGYRQFSKDL